MAAGKLSGTGNAVTQFARENGMTLNQLSLAWLLHRSPVILPIPGTSSIAHLEENAAAAGMTLPDDVWHQFEVILDAQSM